MVRDQSRGLESAKSAQHGYYADFCFERNSYFLLLDSLNLMSTLAEVLNGPGLIPEAAFGL
jgi:hypothetical protein